MTGNPFKMEDKNPSSSFLESEEDNEEMIEELHGDMDNLSDDSEEYEEDESDFFDDQELLDDLDNDYDDDDENLF